MRNGTMAARFTKLGHAGTGRSGGMILAAVALAGLLGIGSGCASWPPRPAPFIDWAHLANPVYAHQGWSTKDACMTYHNGTFYVFFSAFYYDEGRERSHVTAVKTRDFKTFSDPLFIWDGKEAGWIGMCSPNLTRVGDRFVLTYNSWGHDHPNGSGNQLFYAISSDLEHWDKHRPLARNLTEGKSLIDVALAAVNGKFYIVWQDWIVDGEKIKRNRIAVGDTLDGDFAYVGDGYLTFLMADGKWNGMKHENWDFLQIDGVWHLLSTDYSPHEPYLYRVSGDGTHDRDWQRWEQGRRLEMPQEHFNTKHRANAAQLANWTNRDGYYYLLYAGNTETRTHAGRGDNRLALARSRDLVHWEAPPGRQRLDDPVLAGAAHRITVRGWNILSRREEHAEAVIAAAGAYRINHLQLSHRIVHDLKDLRSGDTRELVERLTRRAHAAGIDEVTLWDHALYDLDYYPTRFRTGPGGKLDLDAPAFWDWLRADYRALLDLAPAIDGIVLTFIETGAHAEDQYSRRMPTEAEKLAAVIDAVADVVVEERGLKLYVRTFIYTQAEQESIFRSIELVDNPDIVVMMKATPHDFFLTHPVQQSIGRIARPIIIEFDAAREYDGQGVVANTFTDEFVQRWRYYLGQPRVIGYVARTDRYGDTRIIGRPGEVVLAALDRLIEKPNLSALEIDAEFVAQRYGPAAVAALQPAFQMAQEIALGSFYTLGTNTARHSYLAFDNVSNWTRHVSGRWLTPPEVDVPRGVNRRLHYWKDVVEHLAPARFKEPGGRLERESSDVLAAGWLTPTERINPEYLHWVVEEKNDAVRLAREALDAVQDAGRDGLVDDAAAYADLLHTFERTLIVAQMRRGAAKAYFGYRLWARGPAWRTDEVLETIWEGLDEATAMADRVRTYPHWTPVGQWDWREDAETVDKYVRRMTVEGWDQYDRTVVPPRSGR